MLDSKLYLDFLLQNDIDFYAGVPDSLLKSFCACVTDNLNSEKHVITANEGAAVGQAIGYYLGTNKLPLVYLQNSGLGNIINPLLSLASNEVYGIPMLLMIGWRGEPNVKDEPQHVHQGRVMEKMLDAMEIPYYVLDKNQDLANKISKQAIDKAIKLNTPVAILVKKNTFTQYSINKNVTELQMTREDAIISASSLLPKHSSVICTTGMPSRELYEHRVRSNEGHHMDFLTVGGMGHASQIALSLAKTKTDRQIFCFDGDGAALMHMGSMANIGQSKAANFTHIIFNNGVHDSVGGQPTVGFEIDFSKIANSCGYKNTFTVKDKTDLNNTLQSCINNEGPNFIDVWVKPGNRSDIGRPTTSPSENKMEMMKYLLDL